MSTWKAVVTEKGDALLAKMTQGVALEITHAEIGSGKVDLSLLKQQTSVSTMKQTATIEPVGYPEQGMCALPVTITNEGVTAGYEAWQIGIFANDPDEGKILFFLAQAEDTATNIPSATLMPSYKTQIIFNVEYGAADSVTVDVNPANTVSQAGMENYVAGQIAAMTPDSEKHVAYAQRAGEADKVPYSLTIRLNGGRDEGSNMWTFDGSVSKAVNITPEKIGAAPADLVDSVNDALSDANDAYNLAESANTAAATAQSTANTAKTNAATAQTAAEKAQSTADTAKANAATAQSTANTAKANAATAQSTADTAKTNAATAQSTANTANTTAKAALPKSGGTMTGAVTTKGINLTSGTDYGTSLPSTATKGKLFFLKVSS